MSLAMDGYYTGFTSDVKVDAMRWKWVRLDPGTITGVELSQMALRDPAVIFELVDDSVEPLPLTTVVRGA